MEFLNDLVFLQKFFIAGVVIFIFFIMVLFQLLKLYRKHLTLEKEYKLTCKEFNTITKAYGDLVVLKNKNDILEKALVDNVLAISDIKSFRGSISAISQVADKLSGQTKVNTEVLNDLINKATIKVDRYYDLESDYLSREVQAVKACVIDIKHLLETLEIEIQPKSEAQPEPETHSYEVVIDDDYSLSDFREVLSFLADFSQAAEEHKLDEFYSERNIKDNISITINTHKYQSLIR